MNAVEKVFGNSALHDYKMEKMEIDYPKGTIVLQFLNLRNAIKKFTIRQFTIEESMMDSKLFDWRVVI